jgi:predicted small integral membrane protein
MNLKEKLIIILAIVCFSSSIVYCQVTEYNNKSCVDCTK